MFLRSIGLFSSEPVFQTQNGAIDGYDVVAYFTQSKAVRGAPDITHEFGGASWHFSSDEHRKLFAASPEQYLPRYADTVRMPSVRTTPRTAILKAGILKTENSI